MKDLESDKIRVSEAYVEEPENWMHWLSHELKTPLSRIESLISNLEAKSSYDFEERKLLNKMKESIEECKSTMDTIFIYEQIKKKSIKPSFKQIDLNRVLSSVVAQNDFWAKQKGISLILETEPLFPLMLDENLVFRAISNVLENAIKYSPTESRVLVSSEEMDKEILIQIADQGCGISVNDLNDIFQPYFRTELTHEVPGTGLGLAITASFIKIHGARVEVDSVIGKGSTFTISFPKTNKVTGAKSSKDHEVKNTTADLKKG